MTKRKSIRTIFVIFAATGGAAVFGGCGRSVHSNSTVKSEQARPRATDFIEISWKDANANVHISGNGWAASDGLHYVSDSPISIPAQVPDTLDFKVDVPKRFDSVPLALHADLLRKDGTSSDVSARNLSRESNILKFQFTGVSDAFAKADIGAVGEKRTLLQVTGTDPVTGEMVFEGKINLVTPPTHVSIEQESVSSFEKHAGALPVSKKIIRWGGESLQLLQVLTFHNPSDFSVQFDLPFKPGGRLVAHFQDVRVETRLCSYSTQEFSRSKVLSNKMWVMSLSRDSAVEDLEEIRGEKVRIFVGPQTSVFAGIYSSGKEVQEVAEGSYPKPVFDETDVVDSCNARCGNDGHGWMLWDYRAGEYWRDHGWPGSSTVCQDLRNPFFTPGWKYPPDDQKLIDQCAEWDITTTPVPKDIRRFCGSYASTDSLEKWVIHPHHTTTKSGTQGLPATVEIDPDQLNGDLSFAASNDQGEPEATNTPVFLVSSDQNE